MRNSFFQHQQVGVEKQPRDDKLVSKLDCNKIGPLVCQSARNSGSRSVCQSDSKTVSQAFSQSVGRSVSQSVDLPVDREIVSDGTSKNHLIAWGSQINHATWKVRKVFVVGLLISFPRY